MESRDWTHPDVSLPQLLSLVRAFTDMLLLASGYQASGSPALWRAQDVQRALGWASLLEQIMTKVCKEGKSSRETLDKALQAMMLETFYPEGLPKLSYEVLMEAKKLLIYVMSNALGSCNGQIESLIAASYKDQQDWTVVLQHIRDRFMVVESTKSITKAIELATPVLDRRDHVCCCQRWRHGALSYLLDGKTLYKISGAAVLFSCSELQWKTALQRITDQADGSKLAGIAELCCLQISGHRRSVLITRLLQPCDGMSCSSKALKVWHSKCHNIEAVESKEASAVEAFLHELAQRDHSVWWSLTPILVAATLTKGSFLFRYYVTELSRHMKNESDAEWSRRMEKKRSSGDVLETGGCDTRVDDLVARSWCLKFLEYIDNSNAFEQGT